MSRHSGVPASTLRCCERIGLIASDRERNGPRDYDAQVLERLAFVGTAKQLDLSLPEIAALLDVVESDTCTQVRESFRPRIAARLREVDARLYALQRLPTRLDAASRSADQCPDSGTQCRSECVLLRSDACDPARPDRSGIRR